VVLIETDETVSPPLPVREPAVYTVTFRQIVIDQVRSENGAGKPITAGSRVVITGSALRGDDTVVAFGDSEVVPAAGDLSDTAITVALPAELRAGVHTVQVLHRLLMGQPAMPHKGFESNVAAFALQPSVATKNDGTYDITFLPGDPAAIPPVPDKIQVKLNPKVEQSQKAALLLNRMGAPGTGPAPAYSFNAEPLATGVTESDTLLFPVHGVGTGDYLVRVTVDQATSPLDISSDPSSPLYTGPKVTLP
jgi:hypothetical protein